MSGAGFTTLSAQCCTQANAGNKPSSGPLSFGKLFWGLNSILKLNQSLTFVLVFRPSSVHLHQNGSQIKCHYGTWKFLHHVYLFTSHLVLAFGIWMMNPTFTMKQIQMHPLGRVAARSSPATSWTRLRIQGWLHYFRNWFMTTLNYATHSIYLIHCDPDAVMKTKLICAE